MRRLLNAEQQEVEVQNWGARAMLVSLRWHWPVACNAIPSTLLFAEKHEYARRICPAACIPRPQNTLDLSTVQEPLSRRQNARTVRVPKPGRSPSASHLKAICYCCSADRNSDHCRFRLPAGA